MHDDVQQHQNAKSSIQQRGQVLRPLPSGALPLCAFFYYQLVHCILFVKLHWCMCSGGFFVCLLINLRVQCMWIVVATSLGRVMITRLARKLFGRFCWICWLIVQFIFSRQLANYYSVSVLVSCYLLACYCLCGSGHCIQYASTGLVIKTRCYVLLKYT